MYNCPKFDCHEDVRGNYVRSVNGKSGDVVLDLASMVPEVPEEQGIYQLTVEVDAEGKATMRWVSVD